MCGTLTGWCTGSSRVDFRCELARRGVRRGAGGSACVGLRQVSECVWEADELVYWVESRRLQLKSVKSPSCEMQAVHDDLDAFTVSLFSHSSSISHSVTK